MFGSEVSQKKALLVLSAMLIVALFLAVISVQAAFAQDPFPFLQSQFKIEVFLPPNSPDVTPQPASSEYFSENFALEVFPPPVAPPQPDTYCWDYRALGFCDCRTHQYWEYWCHRCCNEPDYCPTGCCDIYCWWVEAGTCACK